MLIAAIYNEIYTDEKGRLCKEKCKIVGTFLDNSDPNLTDDSPYFEGAVFDWNNQMEGTLKLTKKQFLEGVETWHTGAR